MIAKQEIYWFLSTLLLGLVLVHPLLGLDAWQEDATLNLNLYDTYFVLSKKEWVPLILICSFFTVYLTRGIVLKFKRITVNLLLIIATILTLVLINKITSTLHIFKTPVTSFGNSSPTDTDTPVANLLSMAAQVLFGVQIVLLLLLVFCGFKTGYYYTKNR